MQLNRYLLHPLQTFIVLVAMLIPHSLILAEGNSAFTVESLFALIKKTQPVIINFQEFKTVSYLEIKLEHHGILEFRPPDYLRREVVKPTKEITIITGDQISIKTAKNTKTISMDEHPAIRAFVSAFRAPLAGDSAAINDLFKLKLTGTKAAWILKLRPIKASVSTYLEEIIISGKDDVIETIETIERNGDTSYLILSSSQ